ncbi:hypothetical protein GCM10023081_18470 [Arthrobacter ginkgonis]|uniref:Uncharacterized protein n=1 Tax=Arthrobacter ginkgonis TaxID=1630594 RepID=A0ABP7C8W0_9MICC
MCRWAPRDIDWFDPWTTATPELGIGEVQVGYDGSIAQTTLKVRHGSLEAEGNLLRETGAFFTYRLVIAGPAPPGQVEDRLRAAIRKAPCDGLWTDHDLLVLSRFGWIDDELRNPEYQPDLGFWENTPPPFDLADSSLEVRHIDRADANGGDLPAAVLRVGVSGEAPAVPLAVPVMNYSALAHTLEQGLVHSGGGELVVPDNASWEAVRASIAGHVSSLTVERDWVETMAELSRIG